MNKWDHRFKLIIIMECIILIIAVIYCCYILYEFKQNHIIDIGLGRLYITPKIK